MSYESEMSALQDFVYLIRPKREGFSPATLAPQELETMGRHFAFLQDAMKRGVLVLAGPCLDGSFGVCIFRAENMEKAKEFLAADPAVSEGLMNAELRPFRVALLKS